MARVGVAYTDTTGGVVASGAYIASEFGVVHTHMGSAPFHKPSLLLAHPEADAPMGCDFGFPC